MSDIVVSDAAASEPPAPNYCDPKITGAVEEASRPFGLLSKRTIKRASKLKPIVNEERSSAESLRSWSWKE